MIDLFAKHGLLDVTIKAKGDTYIDEHHTVEDIGMKMQPYLQYRRIQEFSKNVCGVKNEPKPKIHDDFYKATRSALIAKSQENASHGAVDRRRRQNRA